MSKHQVIFKKARLYRYQGHRKTRLNRYQKPRKTRFYGYRLLRLFTLTTAAANGGGRYV